MKQHTNFRRFLLSVLASASLLAGVDASAASAADKVEQLGQLRSLEVKSIRIVRRNDFLNVQADLLNTDRQTQQLYYRFKWFDDAGFTVGAEEGWKPVIVYGNQKKLIEAIAPVQTATDFKIELHSPDNNGRSSD